MKLLYVTGTRADFSKLEPLITASWKRHEVHCAVVGQHLDERYGYTAIEVERRFESKPWRCWRMPNGVGTQPLTQTLATTLSFLRGVAVTIAPDLVIVHGDRTEALAAACLALDGFRVAHIEGGERSGCIDDRIRDMVTSASVLHLACTETAADWLRMFRPHDAVSHIGCPGLDVLINGTVPPMESVTDYYDLPDPPHVLVMLHPEPGLLGCTLHVVDRLLGALETVDAAPIVFAPNSDPGHKNISVAWETNGVRVLPSMRASHFARLLRDARLVIGNSSTVVREAPALGVPAVVVGNRQRGRTKASVYGWQYDEPEEKLIEAMHLAMQFPARSGEFGDGYAAERFAQVLDEIEEAA